MTDGLSALQVGNAATWLDKNVLVFLDPPKEIEEPHCKEEVIPVGWIPCPKLSSSCSVEFLSSVGL